MIQMRTNATLRIALALLSISALAVSTNISSGPISGPNVALAQNDDDEDGGDDDDCGSTGAVTQADAPVTATEPLGVDVSCEWSPDSERSTCAFIPVGTDADALDLLVPIKGICADVTGGDYETDSLDSVDDEDTAYYSARDGEIEVVLVLNGEVSTSGSTIYWIETGGGRQPAAGLGVTCEIPAASTPKPSPSPEAAESTGSITVQA